MAIVARYRDLAGAEVVGASLEARRHNRWAADAGDDRGRVGTPRLPWAGSGYTCWTVMS